MVSITQPISSLLQETETHVKEILASFPQISLSIIFGSVASGRAGVESDLDIAIAAKQPLTIDLKIALINLLAEKLGRPVDLIDLQEVSEPLLGQILCHGRRLTGNDALYGALISRHLFEQADFMPYRRRLLAERRKAWIGK